jgi:C-terminal processing protease CtpA/Prc
MSLLVNQGSASGTELVAAALQHWKRAAVVGARTSGTDSIQTIIPLRQSGFVLILTTGRFLTPGGLGIDGTGITPDEVVEAPHGTRSLPAKTGSAQPDRDSIMTRTYNFSGRSAAQERHQELTRGGRRFGRLRKTPVLFSLFFRLRPVPASIP